MENVSNLRGLQRQCVHALCLTPENVRPPTLVRNGLLVRCRILRKRQKREARRQN